MTKTSIEWAMNPDGTRGEVWNPVTGCNKVSQGCKNCYAERIAERFWGDRPFTEVRLHPERLEDPLHWHKPRRVFVNSMSDLFHKDVPDGFIFGAFMRMAKAQQHKFIILTKRADRMQRWITEWWMTDFNGQYHTYLMLDNVWLGVSVEDQKAADERIPLLLQTPAAVRFVSCEPLLGPLDITGYLTSLHFLGDVPENMFYEPGLDWVIVGGESGPNARPMHPDWARSIRDQCQAAGVPFFFKQWGEWYPSPYQGKNSLAGQYKFDEATNTVRVGKKAAGRLLDGQEWNEYPEVEK